MCGFALQLKWEKYARRLFLKELFIYALFLFMFVVWSILINDAQTNESLKSLMKHGKGVASVVLACILPLFALRALFREGQQMFLGASYVKPTTTNKVQGCLC